MIDLDLSVQSVVFARVGDGAVDAVTAFLATINAAGGQSSFHDYTNAVDGADWLSEDSSDLDNDHTQNSNFREPGVGAGGALFTNANHSVFQTVSGGTVSIAMTLTKSDASTLGNLVSDNSGAQDVRYNNDSDDALGMSVLVDGATINTEGELYTALHQAGEVTVEIMGVDLTGRTELRIGREGSSMIATVRRVAVIDEVTNSGGLAAARTQAKAAVEVA